jgi:CubicO group peptidase (beta-lactamase class C family)
VCVLTGARRMKSLGNILVLTLALAAVVVIAREPVFWKRYFLAVIGDSDPSSSLYQPRERIAGGNQPTAPRVDPLLESLDPRSLEAAASYAGERDSSALIVSRHEHIVFEKYWQGTGFDTLKDGQSFARVVAALAVGAALSERKIHWPDEPIGYFISPWHDDPRGAITVSQLLKMSSGLRAPEPSLNPWGSSVRGSLGPDILAAALAEPLAAKPGSVWLEQSADPQLVASVIERATGMRYAQFVSQTLWRPIGASDAWLWLDRTGGTAHADCCMLAKQGDWIRVAELLVKDGNYRGEEVIHPGWVARMLVPAAGNAAHGSYVRLGKAVPMGLSGSPTGPEPYAADDLFVVEGTGGNRMWVVPSMHLAILRMGHLPRHARDWDDTRIPNLIIHGARDYQPPQVRPGSDISKIVPGH